jgi:hypothetical protein
MPVQQEEASRMARGKVTSALDGLTTFAIRTAIMVGDSQV